MSFFSHTPSTAYKPHIRQEGFSPIPVSATASTPPDVSEDREGNAARDGARNADGDKNFNELFNMPAHTFINDSGMDFADELATMIGGAPSGAGLPGHHHHGSSSSHSHTTPGAGGVGSYGSSYAGGSFSHHAAASHMGQHYTQNGHGQQQQQQHPQQDNGANDETERYAAQTHNIFDISAPIPSASLVGGRPGSVSGHHGHGLTASYQSQQHHSAHPSDFEAYGSPHLVGGLGNLGLGGNNNTTSGNSGHNGNNINGGGVNGNGLGTLGFNSALPALNSSMRYDPQPETTQERNGSPNGASPPPPGTTHPFALQRGTPSPPNGTGGSSSSNANNNNNTISSPSILPAHVSSPAFAHIAPPGAYGGSYGRQPSRSRSRPPTSSGAAAATANGAGGATATVNGGPTRTARARRTGSVSGTSPPPAFGYHSGRLSVSGAPGGAGGSGAVGIVIPGSSGRSGQGSGNGQWFGSSSFSSASEYSLPTPSEPHHSLSHSLSHTQQYNPFSLSPTGTEPHHHQHHPNLPPLHMPGSPYGGGAGQNAQGGHHGHAGHGHSLSLSGKSPLDFGLGAGGHGHGHTHGHSLSMPKSPGVGGMEFAINSFAGGNGGGAAATATNPPNGPPLLPINTSVSARSIGPTSPLAAGAVSPNTGTPASAASAGGVGGDKQSLLANEKRRRRRESHNAVERRRRDNINEKISELATLIPECMLDGGATNASTGGAAAAAAKESGSGSPPATTSPSALETSEPLLPTPTGDKGVKDEVDAEGGVVKANKGMILRKSVEYIRYLQQLVTAQGARNRELELELKQYRGGSSGAPSEAGGEPKHGVSDKDGDDQDQEMILHDDGMGLDGGMDFGNLGSYGVGGMLPTMPEDDNEDSDAHNGEMDVDSNKERGRPRDVRVNGRHGGPVNGALKEEHEDEPQLGFSVAMQA